MDNIEYKMKDLELTIRADVYKELLSEIKADKELLDSPAGKRFYSFLVGKLGDNIGQQFTVLTEQMQNLGM